MKVVFLQDVPKVAEAGEIKDVANGYARNFLIPKKLALLASSSAASTIEAQLKAKELSRNQNLAILIIFDIFADCLIFPTNFGRILSCLG